MLSVQSAHAEACFRVNDQGARVFADMGPAAPTDTANTGVLADSRRATVFKLWVTLGIAVICVRPRPTSGFPDNVDCTGAPAIINILPETGYFVSVNGGEVLIVASASTLEICAVE